MRRSDQAGLAVAVILHTALAGLLVLQIDWGSPAPAPKREGIAVSLASEVSLESTAPDPVAVARAATAPTVGEDAPEPTEREITEPRREERPVPTPRSTTRPRSEPSSTPRSTPSTAPRSTPSSTPRPTPSRDPGSSRFDDAFNSGTGDSPSSQNTGTPAQNYGPSELASLNSAVARQVRAKWQGRVPQGPDAEKLVTRVRFKLNPDGSLLGTPQVLRTTGQTDLNRNQVGRHQEEAVRAIRLVGRFRVPFDVPASNNTFTLDFDR